MNRTATKKTEGKNNKFYKSTIYIYIYIYIYTSSGFILSLVALLRLDTPLGNAGQSHLPEDRFGIYIYLRVASS